VIPPAVREVRAPAGFDRRAWALCGCVAWVVLPDDGPAHLDAMPCRAHEPQARVAPLGWDLLEVPTPGAPWPARPRPWGDAWRVLLEPI
jgi:hypothetical protein